MARPLRHALVRLALVGSVVTSIAAGCSSEPAPAHTGDVIWMSAESVGEPFPSNGDLWFSTWAAPDTLYVSWGDGLGPEPVGLGPRALNAWPYSHNGLARLDGDPPNLKATVVHRYMPLSDDTNDSKPSSLLFINGRLIVAIHSPLLTPTQGLLAWSDDGGTTLTTAFSPERKKGLNENYICLMFVNDGLGQAARDGFVYAFGAPAETNYDGQYFLARLPADTLLDESTWSYFVQLDAAGAPVWSNDWHDAKAVPTLSSAVPGADFQVTPYLSIPVLFSAVFDPYVNRYLVMTATQGRGELYQASAVWGPWKRVGRWFEGTDSPWFPAYMPGIITKGMDTNSFYFTVSGRTDFTTGRDDPKYRLRLGRMYLVVDR